MSLTLGVDVTHANIKYAPVNKVQMAGYVTGSPDIVWTAADWQLYPNAVRIDQSPANTPLDETADVLDVENGAATLADIVPWTRAALANFAKVTRTGQRLPLIYTSAANVTPVANVLTGAGLTKGDVGLWVASWQGKSAADVDIMTASGPFPIHAFQLDSATYFDVDLFSTAWLNTRSGHAAKPPVIEHGIVIDSNLITYKVVTTDKKHWNV